MKRFTLTELLVVIAIVAVLMTLLLPSLGQARISTKKAICKSNNSQIYSLQILYSKDHNHHFTMGDSTNGGSYSWDDFLSPYDGRNLPDSILRNQRLGSKEDFAFDLYTCPLAKDKHEAEPSRSYAMNRGWFRGNGHINGIGWDEGSIQISQVEDTTTMVFYEMDATILRLSRAHLGNSSNAFFRGSWRNWTTQHGKLHMSSVLQVNGSVSEQNLMNPTIWSRDID